MHQWMRKTREKRHDSVTSKMNFLRRHCSVRPLSHPISLGPTFSNSPLSYASIDVLWSHFSGSKPYFATIFKRVIFFEQPEEIAVFDRYHIQSAWDPLMYYGPISVVLTHILQRFSNG